MSTQNALSWPTIKNRARGAGESDMPSARETRDNNIIAEQLRRNIDVSLRAYKRPNDARSFAQLTGDLSQPDVDSRTRLSYYTVADAWCKPSRIAEPTVYTQDILDEPDLWTKSVGYRYQGGEMSTLDAHNAFLRSLQSTTHPAEAENRDWLLDHINGAKVRSSNTLPDYSDVDSDDDLADMAESALSLGSQKSGEGDFKPMNDLFPDSRRPSLTGRRTLSSSSRTRPELGSLTGRMTEDALLEE
ncbi:hypothetical protein IAT40_005097 [Kwoniella sp. CBS 6097]